MKQWHGVRPSGGNRDEPGGLPPYPMDSEDAAIAAPAASGAAASGAAASGVADARSQAGGSRLSSSQLDRWIAGMERLQLGEYLRYVNDRKRMLWTNFIGGLARGLGMAVGFTILGAGLVLFLQNLAKHNLPLIGDVLAEIVSIVQARLK